ncbi:MAG: amidohydrolase family protein, partial [Clostridia bacterium]|nr:amidohydrolase family protein [Deltaproteobacteria bacterium]
MAPERLVIRTGELVDGSGGPIARNQRIVIEHGVITSVANDTGDEPDGVVIDARRGTVSPGLVMTAVAPTSDASLEVLMRHGVTTVELVAGDIKALVATRDRIGVARHRGPRIVAGGVLAEADSVQEMRNAVRKAAELSAETVHLVRGDGVEEALCAFIDEAHAQDMQAMVTVDNAAALEAVRDCAAATVIWHAAYAPHLDPEPLREPPEVIVDVSSGLPSAPLWQATAALTGLSYDAHMLVAATYSALVTRPVAAGLTREGAMRALTNGPALALGLGDAIGKIAKDYRADLVVSEQDGTTAHVFIDGIDQRLRPSSFLERFRGLD